MAHLINNGQPQPNPLALELVKYRVLGKTYAKWRAIITEATGESDTLFKLALQKCGIKIEDENQMIYIVQDTQSMREMTAEGILNPTMLQLFLATRVIGLSEQEAIDQMEAWLDARKVGAQEPAESSDECEQCGCPDYSPDLACCPSCGGKRP